MSCCLSSHFSTDDIPKTNKFNADMVLAQFDAILDFIQGKLSKIDEDHVNRAPELVWFLMKRLWYCLLFNKKSSNILKSSWTMKMIWKKHDLKIFELIIENAVNFLNFQKKKQRIR